MGRVANIVPACDGSTGSVVEPEFTLDDAHAFRSRFIEKCAEAERYVLTLLRVRGGKQGSRATLSAKVEALRLALNRQAPRKRHELKIEALLKELAPLADLRSELVHSTMSMGTIAGTRVFVLANAGEQHDIIDRRVIVQAARAKEIRAKLSHVVNQLKQVAEGSSPDC